MPRKQEEVVCAQCSRKFMKDSHAIRAAERLNYNLYCSKECHGLAKKKRVSLTCAECSKPIERCEYEVRKSDSGLFFCDHSCKAKYSNRQHEGENHPSYKHGKGAYRRKALLHYGAKCSVCGYDIEPALDVHHRDGNRKHNNIENLDVLCPTHHREYQLGIRQYDRMVGVA